MSITSLQDYVGLFAAPWDGLMPMQSSKRPIVISTALTIFVIAYDHYVLSTTVTGLSLMGHIRELVSGAFFRSFLEIGGWPALGFRTASVLALFAAQALFFWASLVSSWRWRVVYVFALAATTFIEYGYVNATDTLLSAIDIYVVHSSRQYWSSEIAASVNWLAAVPVGVHLLTLLAMRPAPRSRGLRLSATVFAVTLSLHSAYAAVAYFSTNSGGMMVGSTMSTGTMQSFARSITLFGWSQVASAVSGTTDQRGVVSFAANSAPTVDVVLVIDETVEAAHLSLNGYGRTTTPWLDTLQAQGRLANWGVASSYAPLSNPSIAALMAGLTTLPDRDGRVFSQPTMFQFAKAMKFGTHMFDGQWDAPRFGLTAGDHRYIDEFKGVRFFGNDPDTDVRIATRVREVLQKPGGQFVVVLKRGSHPPYTRAYPSSAALWSAVPSPEESDSYDDGLRYNIDAFFRALLHADGTLPGAVVIYTSDHGRRYDDFPHGHAVPLLMLGDARPPVDTGFRAGHVNIFATLLDLFQFPEEHRPVPYGRSLLKARATDADPRLAIIGDLFGRETFEVRNFDKAVK